MVASVEQEVTTATAMVVEKGGYDIRHHPISLRQARKRRTSQFCFPPSYRRLLRNSKMSTSTKGPVISSHSAALPTEIICNVSLQWVIAQVGI